MSDSAMVSPNSSSGCAPTCASELHWYAVYTRAQHEKSVARQLDLRAIESFLPMYEKLSRWKDRRVKLQLPLFSGYVFVRVAPEEKLLVLQVPGIVRLVGFGGRPIPLHNEEMRTLREGLSGSILAEPCPYLRVGRRVRINCGPFAGLQGILKRKKASLRVVISVDLIQRSMIVDVDAAEIEPVD